MKRGKDLYRKARKVDRNALKAGIKNCDNLLARDIAFHLRELILARKEKSLEQLGRRKWTI